MKKNPIISIAGASSLNDLKGKDLLIYPSIDFTKVKNFDLQHFTKHEEKYLRLFSRIYETLTSDKRYKNLTDYVGIHSDEISGCLNTRQRKQILTNLENSGLIEIDHSYKVNEYTKGYRLGPVFRNPTELVIRPAKAFRQSRNQICTNPISTYLDDQFKRLRLDDLSFDYCLDKYNYSLQNNSCVSSTSTTHHPTFPYVFTITQVPVFKDPNKIQGYRVNKVLHDLAQVSRILTGNYKPIFRDQTSHRIHSFLTSLRKELRGFLSIKDLNEDLYSIDLANSQVFLLNLLLRSKYPTDQESQDVKKFYEITSSGQFYEHCGKVLLGDRAYVKKNFFKKYLFCKNKYADPKIIDLMSSEFPTVHKFVTEAKLANHKDLAIGLQKAESELFIDRIVPRLIASLGEKDFVATIHDSIITNKSAVAKVESVIMDEFAKVGLKPTLKMQIIKKISKSSTQTSTGVGHLQIKYTTSTAIKPVKPRANAIPVTFKKYGYQYKLLKKTKKVALYERYKHIKDPKGRFQKVVTYEVHLIRVKKITGPNGKSKRIEFLAKESQFGSRAWACTSIDNAMRRYKELAK
jgi:hypothetical protein